MFNQTIPQTFPVNGTFKGNDPYGGGFLGDPILATIAAIVCAANIGLLLILLFTYVTKLQKIKITVYIGPSYIRVPINSTKYHVHVLLTCESRISWTWNGFSSIKYEYN